MSGHQSTGAQPGRRAPGWGRPGTDLAACSRASWRTTGELQLTHCFSSTSQSKKTRLVRAALGHFQDRPISFERATLPFQVTGWGPCVSACRRQILRWVQFRLQEARGLTPKPRQRKQGTDPWKEGRAGHQGTDGAQRREAGDTAARRPFTQSRTTGRCFPRDHVTPQAHSAGNTAGPGSLPRAPDGGLGHGSRRVHHYHTFSSIFLFHGIKNHV